MGPAVSYPTSGRAREGGWMRSGTGASASPSSTAHSCQPPKPRTRAPAAKAGCFEVTTSATVSPRIRSPGWMAPERLCDLHLYKCLGQEVDSQHKLYQICCIYAMPKF